MEALLADLASAADAPVTADDRLILLLADFLACVGATPGPTNSHRLRDDGSSGLAGDLAIRASLRDLDDVDWSSLHHPGSVVWPAVVAVAGATSAWPSDVARAARAGYRTAATIADALGPPHRAAWHVTATAGAMGAASAASVLMGLPPGDHARALALAAANLGGLAAAARERRGAAVFNRAAAVTLGLSAARGAAWGLTALDRPLSGTGGVHDVMAGAGGGRVTAIREGLPETGVRIYPVCGFLQSAAEAAAALREQVGGRLTRMEVTVAEGIVPLLGHDAGPWWDARLSLARVWASGTPWAIAAPGAGDADAGLVTVRGGALAPGETRVAVTTSEGSGSSEIMPPPSVEEADAPRLLREKWTTVLCIDPDEPVSAALAILTGTEPVTVPQLLAGA